MNRKFLWMSGILLLLLAAALFWFLRQRGTEQHVAIISQNGQILRTVDLDTITETETFVVGEPGAQNTIQISPEGIGVISADCPDQVCVHQGLRQHGPEPIVCLPNGLSIRFSATDPSGLDAVTGGAAH
ncbi:NusG domain II-containing protein [Pseudoflavonifractor sp. DSM 107456]|uniref:NusG domain II-containing protein n=1 Tax=Pseudoflavonifractor gallinarum TaxID=2779352 RepID=A0ABR9R9B3_9FIRM|nr:NusG domain II-containing protein [Pseudoflavonifractor gallinarum]MBE5054908.1 NusG domain II-containing protein [Pseudoflavonifractor gallinarum]